MRIDEKISKSNLSPNFSNNPRAHLSIYLSIKLRCQTDKELVNILVDGYFFPNFIIQIPNRMMTRQTTTLTPRMLCLRKPKGVLQQIKIFPSETSWHKFQICLQTKTLDSKVNTMCVLLSRHPYLTCIFIFNFLVKNTNTLSNYTLKISI